MAFKPKSEPHNRTTTKAEREAIESAIEKNNAILNKEKQLQALETQRQIKLIEENILLSIQAKKNAMQEKRKKAEEEIKNGMSPEERTLAHRKEEAKAAAANAAAEAGNEAKREITGDQRDLNTVYDALTEGLSKEQVKQVQEQMAHKKENVAQIGAAGNFDDINQFKSVKSRISAMERLHAKPRTNPSVAAAAPDVGADNVPIQKPMSPKYRADYIEAINEPLDKIPIKRLEDFTDAEHMLANMLHSDKNAIIPEQWHDRAKDIQERLNSPEEYAKPEHHDEYRQINRQRIAAKITEFKTMSESDKLAYIQNQQTPKPAVTPVASAGSDYETLAQKPQGSQAAPLSTPKPTLNMAPAPDTRTDREKCADAAEKRQEEATAAKAVAPQPSLEQLIQMNPLPCTENAATSSSISQQAPIHITPPTTPMAPSSTPTAPTPLPLTRRAPKPAGAR